MSRQMSDLIEWFVPFEPIDKYYDVEIPPLYSKTFK